MRAIHRPPYPGAGNGDRALPNIGETSQTGNPPDATRSAGTELLVSTDVADLQTTIIDAIAAEISSSDITPKKDNLVQGTSPDNYVSAFVGYHSVWYDAWKTSCQAGWHTHVGYGMTVATASQAMDIQLEELISWLDSL